MDSAKPILTDEDFSEMIAQTSRELKQRLSPQKAAAMIEGKRQPYSEIVSCQTCVHYTPYRTTRMQTRVPKLDLCLFNIENLRPLPPGAHGCENYTALAEENYMGKPAENSKGACGEPSKDYTHGERKVTVNVGDIMIPVPKQDMTLIRVEKDVVILATPLGMEYRFNIADWNFDLPSDKDKKPPGRPLISDVCNRGDYLQIFSFARFKFICKTQQQYILENQKGVQVPFDKNTYCLRVVSKADFRAAMPEYKKDVHGGKEYRGLYDENCIPGDIVQIVSIAVFEFTGMTNKIYILRNTNSNKEESVNKGEFGLFFVEKNPGTSKKVEVVGGSSKTPKS